MDGDVWFYLVMAWHGWVQGKQGDGFGESHVHLVMLRSVSNGTLQDLAIAELRIIRGVHCS